MEGLPDTPTGRGPERNVQVAGAAEHAHQSPATAAEEQHELHVRAGHRRCGRGAAQTRDLGLEK